MAPAEPVVPVAEGTIADQQSLIPAAVQPLGAVSQLRGVWQWASASV